MESKWRMNVWDKGLGWSGATLCSRLLGPLNDFIWLTNEKRADGLRVMWVRLDTVPDAPYWRYYAGPGRGNFPYGYPVEPDLPV